MTPAKPVPISGSKSSTGSDDLFVTTEMIKKTHTQELVIALCGPIGSPLHEVSEALKERLLQDFGYERCEIVRLSDFIKKHLPESIEETSRFENIKSLIKAGDKLREAHDPSILAEFAIHYISQDREKHSEALGNNHHKPRRVCHIIDSVKNQEELDLLRIVYREMLYFVGVFSPLSVRQESMEKSGLKTPEVYELIDKDSGEEIDHGQTVRDTFPESDFFLRIDSNTQTQLNRKVKRFLDLILGTKIITPTPSETAMYTAASAASNSACLSRQVGAALTDKEGNILSVGWNDVPKTGGGLYQSDPTADPGSEKDHRCWNSPGKCSNDDEKKEIAGQIAEELVRDGIVLKKDREKAETALRKNSKLKGLIEFSRAVHAEMHAIIAAGQKNGGLIREGKLFCTTYPCHSCARHIIAAGINEVYYIEPYRKSLATRLHGDAITEDENATSMTRILPYEGVAPSRYLDLFKMTPNSRKDKISGRVKYTVRIESVPRITKTLEALPTLESIVVQGLKNKNLIEVEE
ncbi:MAG: anti-phage dCTP deaminase [Sedimenticola sp.]|nr:anti-phage dCTP deaminase [Sedimenticola sp.]